MALVPCPDCGSQISSSASTCPKCDYNKPKTYSNSANAQQQLPQTQIPQAQIRLRPPSGWKGLSITFFLISFIVGWVGRTLSLDDPSVVGGDAYNYIIGAGRGTALICFAIILALAGVACAIFDLTARISYYNKQKH